MDFYDKTGNTSTSNQLKLRELPQSQITKVNMKYMYKQCEYHMHGRTSLYYSHAPLLAFLALCVSAQAKIFGLLA